MRKQIFYKFTWAMKNTAMIPYPALSHPIGGWQVWQVAMAGPYG